VLLGSAGLKMPIHSHYFWRVLLTRKVGQTDLVFGVLSWIICATLVDPNWIFYILTLVTSKHRYKLGVNLAIGSITSDAPANLVTIGQ